MEDDFNEWKQSIWLELTSKIPEELPEEETKQ
jgi:hypothetical protein